MAHKWIDAIIWKFCDLDQEPHDRLVLNGEALIDYVILLSFN